MTDRLADNTAFITAAAQGSGRATALAYAADPILTRFKAAVQEAYGDRLARILLFGSRARGDAHPGSDYDVAVFLTALDHPWTEMKRLADIGTDILLDTGETVNAMPFQSDALERRTLFMHELRTDGRDIL